VILVCVGASDVPSHPIHITIYLYRSAVNSGRGGFVSRAF